MVKKGSHAPSISHLNDHMQLFGEMLPVGLAPIHLLLLLVTHGSLPAHHNLASRLRFQLLGGHSPRAKNPTHKVVLKYSTKLVFSIQEKLHHRLCNCFKKLNILENKKESFGSFCSKWKNKTLKKQFYESSQLHKNDCRWWLQRYLRVLFDRHKHLLLVHRHFAHRLWQLQGFAGEFALEDGHPNSVDF